MNALNYESIVANHIERWKSLLAWGGAIPKIEYTFQRYKRGVGGWAMPRRGRMVIRLTGSLAWDLMVVLHEMAHLAAPSDEHHGPVWKRVYVRAAAEALGVDVDDFDINVTKRGLDEQVRDATEMFLEGA